jgi:hypothetical protein
MSEAEDRLDRLAAELSKGYGEVSDDVEARLTCADMLQDALTKSLGSASYEAISKAHLEQRSGIASDEIYGLVHADRRYAFSLGKVQRVLRAVGFHLSYAPA